MQQLTIIGNLGADAQVKESNGMEYIVCSVGCTKVIKAKEEGGENKSVTNWYSVIMDIRKKGLLKFLTKGSRHLFQGDFSVKVYKTNNGTYAAGLNLRADRVELVQTKKTEGDAEAETGADPMDTFTPPQFDGAENGADGIGGEALPF